MCRAAVCEQAPVFSNIDIALGDVSGRLKCSATGDPAPTLFWIQPNGRTTKYSPSTSGGGGGGGGAVVVQAPALVALPGTVEDGARRTDGALVLGGPTSSTPLTGMYICVANNDAGNVTLAVNISWPPTSPPAGAPPPLPRPTAPSHLGLPLDLGLDDGDSGAFPVNLTLSGDEWVKWVHERRTAAPTSPGGAEQAEGRLFSVTELVCAVVVTHVATLIVVVVLVGVLVRHRAARRRRQQQLLPPINPATAAAAAAVPAAGVGDRRPAPGLPVGVSSTYRGAHNGFQLPGMTTTAGGLGGGRCTPYANDCLYESGTMRSGFSYTASNRR